MQRSGDREGASLTSSVIDTCGVPGQGARTIGPTPFSCCGRDATLIHEDEPHRALCRGYTWALATFTLTDRWTRIDGADRARQPRPPLPVSRVRHGRLERAY